MNKKLIKLTEADLHKIVKQSVNRVLREAVDSVSPDPFGTSADSFHEPTNDEIREFNRRRPYHSKTSGLSSIGLLHKMQERITIAQMNSENGMQGLLEDLEDLINACEKQIRMGN